jgi:hypothetical protein
MAEYADLLYSSRSGSTIPAVNVVSSGRRREFSPHDRRRERRSTSRQGRSRRKRDPWLVQGGQLHLLLSHYIR